MYNRFKMCISTFYILSCKSLTLIDLTQSATQCWPNVTVFSNFFFFLNIALKYTTTIGPHKTPWRLGLKKLFGRKSNIKFLSLSWYLPITLNVLVFINYILNKSSR